MLHSIMLQSDGKGGFTATSVRIRPKVKHRVFIPTESSIRRITSLTYRKGFRTTVTTISGLLAAHIGRDYTVPQDQREGGHLIEDADGAIHQPITPRE
jgi:hypothetical protein